jgi:hypothetical protein
MKAIMKPIGVELGPQTPSERRDQAYELRVQAAAYYRSSSSPLHLNNGDEEKYRNQNYYANFTKGLPHDPATGEVDPDAYRGLLRALESGRPQDFEDITLGSAALPLPQRLLLVNPQCGYAFDLEGIDPHQLTMKPSYEFRSAGEIGEIAENYWMAICRDVPFVDYDTNADVKAAAGDLNNYAQFDGPVDPAMGNKVTSKSLFRGVQGDVVGPYLSQFMILPLPFGAQQISPVIQFGVPETDYLKTEAEWLAVQNGVKPAGPPVDLLAKPHIIRNGRDLGQYVHIDELFQAYLNACLLLITPNLPKGRGGFNAPLDDGNTYKTSRTQTGFGTLGEPNFKTIVTEVATRALKAVWFQKWFVHRRLRPEAFGGRLHYHFAHGKKYDFHMGHWRRCKRKPVPGCCQWHFRRAVPFTPPMEPATQQSQELA